MRVLISETLGILIFLFVIHQIGRKKGAKETFFFAFPIGLFSFFIELMGINQEKYVFSDGFSFYVFGVPLAVLGTWVALFYLVFFLTNRLNNRFGLPFSTLRLSLIDGLVAVVMSLILEPFLVDLGLWAFQDEAFYFDIPLWNFIGRFLSISILSFGYRSFKELDFKKRMVFTSIYVAVIILIRFLAYRVPQYLEVI